jgi:hypothetical protein
MDHYLRGISGYALGLLITIPPVLWEFTKFVLGDFIGGGGGYGSSGVDSMLLQVLNSIPSEVSAFIFFTGILISVVSVLKYGVLSGLED